MGQLASCMQMNLLDHICINVIIVMYHWLVIIWKVTLSLYWLINFVTGRVWLPLPEAFYLQTVASRAWYPSPALCGYYDCLSLVLLYSKHEPDIKKHSVNISLQPGWTDNHNHGLHNMHYLWYPRDRHIRGSSKPPQLQQFILDGHNTDNSTLTNHFCCPLFLEGQSAYMHVHPRYLSVAICVYAVYPNIKCISMHKVIHMLWTHHNTI